MVQYALMSEVPKRFVDLSPTQKAHFLYPVIDRSTSSPLLRAVPSWRGRHGLMAVLLENETDKPSQSTRDYWDEHGLPQPKRVNEAEAQYLITSGYQDFGRITASANRRLRVEGVMRRKRPPIVRRSHELLKIARVRIEDLQHRTDQAIPALALKYARKPEVVFFGLRTAIPLRGTVYDHEAGLVKLNDTYRDWFNRYREKVRDAGITAGCPALAISSGREDGSRTNMLAMAWEGYVSGVYAGKPRTAIKNG